MPTEQKQKRTILDLFDFGRSPAAFVKEITVIAEQAAEGNIPVLPGKAWSLHYPDQGRHRSKHLQQLLEGTVEPETVADSLAPDALVFDVFDVEKIGLDAVLGKVRDTTAFISNFDYLRYARFIASMKGKDVSLDRIDELYRGIVHARVQQQALKRYGGTGQQQIRTAMAAEAAYLLSRQSHVSRTTKVLDALKVHWLCEGQNLATTEDRDRAVAGLSAEERKLFHELKRWFNEFVETGNKDSYQHLEESIRNGLPTIPDTPPKDQSQEMQKLNEELKHYEQQVGPVGSEQDKGIPPDDSDEYHTPPAFPQTEGEKKRPPVLFEIEPPLEGYYCMGRKSYFNIDRKVWSKRKQLTSYSQTPVSTPGTKRWKMSWKTDVGIKSIPLPNGYALDAASLKFNGSAELLRDQNGCFYLDTKGSGDVSVEFIKEQTMFIGPVIAEDVEPLYRGQLSSGTEQVLRQVTGDTLQKVERIRQYLLAQHFYPGGGDPQVAQALQYKLQQMSTGDTYIQTLDASEYLECYSANTLFIAMLRKCNIPSRLVVGHHVEGSKKGKSAIDNGTGHAWAEVWDGSSWRRFDATPPPKPEDKKPDEKQEKKDQADKAEDDGVDNQQPQQQDTQTGQEPNVDPTQGMGNAKDKQMQEGQKQLDKAKARMSKLDQQKRDLQTNIDQAEKFSDLADAKKELDKQDLLEQTRKELEEALKAKEQQMKDKIEEQLDQMEQDGFLDEKAKEKIEQQLDKLDLSKLDAFVERLKEETALYQEYDAIRNEVMQQVEQWFQYFVEKLPREQEPELDEDSRSRQGGAFDRRSIRRIRDLMLNVTRHPVMVSESMKPRFIASIMLDVSGSMKDDDKLKDSRKLLVFYCELFSMISRVFGYIKFDINVFADSVKEIKDFEQDYDSADQYAFSDGTTSTVKVRLMKALKAKGGTNMLDAVQKAARELNRQVAEFPDHASAFYFIGDGGDTCDNEVNIRRFLRNKHEQRGFGRHMKSAILLGPETERQVLAAIFGEEETHVAQDLPTLINQSMDQFDRDMDEYFRGMKR